MNSLILQNTLRAFFIFFMSVVTSCNSNNKTKTKVVSTTNSQTEVISDTIVQFLLTSAAKDFKEHQPPTAIDVRNVKIGYITSPKNEKIFVLCGEFLSQENKEQWVSFTTIKTSGYEQYTGTRAYCEDATLVLADENLSVELKNKLSR